ncbi:nuclear transport factor 2 family protein [Sphingomonas sp. So64.6b]|uniref:nuclear transport factor 2 family protein n=1 Tax=Sphingomonas sp. So64.6b TaxID=2997354 RepID=UPI0015FFFD54|nr:nuclear transport factor 2 family protein [Sphingomonas sp. So64.6b]QNA83341.1 nuclear transport factor 2 family protein [Sphingomonas sp. So64.6b]
MTDPLSFATEWSDAWNAHDLERVLGHFHDDVVFTSPVAAAILPETRGQVRGKEALRAYWTEGLRRIPDLHFTVEQVFAGVDTVVIRYRNQKGVSVSEVLIFDGDKVRSGHGTYPVGAENPAGA